MPRGFIDLHCHWVAAIDDGVRAPAAGIALLRGLHELGFSTVMATPHMRPGMFDNDQASLSRAFDAMSAPLAEARAEGPLPAVHLASEHFFDDVVFGRLVRGEALPYGGLRRRQRLQGSPVSGRDGATPPPRLAAVLVEFGTGAFPVQAQHRFFDLRRAGLVPVLAHPERYEPVWRDDTCLDPLLDAGAHLLLDVCALVGKYGQKPQRAAEKLLEEDAYEAACSDAHRPGDVDIVAKAIDRLEALVGVEEAHRLLADGPRGILEEAGTG